MTEPSPAPPPTPSQTPVPFGPVTEPERIVTLDVLRGFALLGIFMVNMQFFSMVFSEFFESSVFEEDTAMGDTIAWGVVKGLFEYKFISLFSLMFGAGLVLQFTRAEQRGRTFVPVYLRRLVVLALIGLVHGFLLWYGDILFLYACVGAVVLLFRKLKAKWLIIIAGSVLTFFLLVQVSVGTLVMVFSEEIEAMQAATEVEEAPADDTAADEDAEEEAAADDTNGDPEDLSWSERNPELTERFPWLGVMIDAGFDPTSQKWIDAETAAYRDGPFTDALAFRTFTYLLALLFAPVGYGWRVVGMFFLGAGLMKLDIFAPSRRNWHWRFFVVGMAIGLPLELANVVLAYIGGVGARMDLMVMGGMLHEIGSFALCLGIVGGVALLVAGGFLPRLVGGIACVGRLALSNYILQTVVSTFLLYWWGLGFFGDPSRVEQFGLVVLIYGGQIVGSVLWLRVFSIGPLEWLWRTLTYLKPQPLLRRS